MNKQFDHQFGYNSNSGCAFHITRKQNYNRGELIHEEGNP